MKSAREFFYSYYDKESKQRSFQKKSFDLFPGHWISPVYKIVPEVQDVEYARNSRKIFSFEQKFSNDYRIEGLYIDFLKNIDPRLRRKMNRLFVAHTYDNNFRAYVKDHSDMIDGEIVFIEWFLSSAIISYSHAISLLYFALIGYKESPWMVDELYDRLEFLKLEKELFFKKKTDTKLINEYKKNIKKCFLGTIPITSGGVAFFVQAGLSFLVAHEVAHYLLRHLEGHNSYYDWVRFSYTDVISSPQEHQKEFHADLLGILIASNSLHHLPVLPHQIKPTFYASLGALLVFTVLGQHYNPFIDSKSHPRILHRLNVCLNLFEKTMKYSDFHPVITIIKSFQKLLYKSQDFGLGSLIPSDYYILPWEE